ncbi:MAG: S1/P1 nuclease, partial [Minisyncoccia bacterium]
MKKANLLVFSVVLMLASQEAFSWGDVGHKTIGRIADGLLNSNARKHVSEILGSDVATLENAAVWPDCLRRIHDPHADGDEIFWDPQKHHSDK